jgi:hypothetical protein
MSAKSHIIYLVIIPDYENNLEFHFFRRGARATFTNMPLTQSGGAGYLGAGWLCDGTVMLPVLITPVVAGLHLPQQFPTAPLRLEVFLVAEPLPPAGDLLL